MISYNRSQSIKIFCLFREKQTTEFIEELTKTLSAAMMKRQRSVILEKVSACGSCKHVLPCSACSGQQAVTTSTWQPVALSSAGKGPLPPAQLQHPQQQTQKPAEMDKPAYHTMNQKQNTFPALVLKRRLASLFLIHRFSDASMKRKEKQITKGKYIYI